MQELEKQETIPLDPVSLERLQRLWESSEAGKLGFNPKIEQGFELRHYVGNALLALRLKIGVLRSDIVPTIKPDELAKECVARLEWIEKDLDIVEEALLLAMNRMQGK